jgi:hypothetical protein
VSPRRGLSFTPHGGDCAHRPRGELLHLSSTCSRPMARPTCCRCSVRTSGCRPPPDLPLRDDWTPPRDPDRQGSLIAYRVPVTGAAAAADAVAVLFTPMRTARSTGQRARCGVRGHLPRRRQHPCLPPWADGAGATRCWRCRPAAPPHRLRNAYGPQALFRFEATRYRQRCTRCGRWVTGGHQSFAAV